jgi:hypothetical protein
MDEGDLEPEEPTARSPVEQVRAFGIEPLERGEEVLGLDRDVVHPGPAPRNEATDRSVLARGRHELDAAIADEHRGCLDTLVDERLPALEAGTEERLVRRDRLVEIGDGDAEVVDASHARDAIGAR